MSRADGNLPRIQKPVAVVDPESFRQRRIMDEKLRARIEQAVERLIAALDAFDAPEEDLEPTMGSLGQGQLDEAEGPDDDLEPSLGSSDRMMDQRKSWSARYVEGTLPGTDAELDTADREPSLGSDNDYTGTRGQLFWANGRGDDREQDAGDEGEPSLNPPSLNPLDGRP